MILVGKLVGIVLVHMKGGIHLECIILVDIVLEHMMGGIALVYKQPPRVRSSFV